MVTLMKIMRVCVLMTGVSMMRGVVVVVGKDDDGDGDDDHDFQRLQSNLVWRRGIRYFR